VPSHWNPYKSVHRPSVHWSVTDGAFLSEKKKQRKKANDESHQIPYTLSRDKVYSESECPPTEKRKEKNAHKTRPKIKHNVQTIGTHSIRMHLEFKHKK